jgi:hypothetical protein
MDRIYSKISLNFKFSSMCVCEREREKHRERERREIFQHITDTKSIFVILHFISNLVLSIQGKNNVPFKCLYVYKKHFRTVKVEFKVSYEFVFMLSSVSLKM